VDGTYLKRFLTYTGKSRSLVSSTRFNVITTALSTTLPALPHETYMSCHCFSLFASLLLFGLTIPEPNEFRQLDTFPHLRNIAPKLTPQPASCTPIAFHRVPHPWLFSCLQMLHTLFASLNVLFLPFSVSVVLCLLMYRVFLRVSSRETIHANFSVGGHSSIVDLTFRITTCRFLLAIVFRT